MLLKYKGNGCYRFIDEVGNIIYVGSAKNIDRRLNSHFKGKQGHLGKDVYNQVARVEICKLEDYPTTLGMEIFLINEYKPKFNKKDKSHNINSKVTKNNEAYKKLEKWELYYKFKKLDKEKINLSKKEDMALMLVSYAVFIIAIVMFIF